MSVARVRWPLTVLASLDDITVRLGGRTVLDGVALRVRAGERVCVLGPSGAGKTTLLRVLGAVQPIASGTATLFGCDTARGSEAECRRLRARVGTIPQDLALLPGLRVFRNVLQGRLGSWSFVRSLRAMVLPSLTERRELIEVLGRVGMADFAYETTAALSYGQKQRVAIARVLYQQPEFVLADEPVSSLDPARAHDLLSLLGSCVRDPGHWALVVSLHDPVLARRFFDRCIGIRAGKIVFDGPVADLSDDRVRELYALPSPENV